MRGPAGPLVIPGACSGRRSLRRRRARLRGDAGLDQLHPLVEVARVLPVAIGLHPAFPPHLLDRRCLGNHRRRRGRRGRDHSASLVGEPRAAGGRRGGCRHGRYGCGGVGGRALLGGRSGTCGQHARPRGTAGRASRMRPSASSRTSRSFQSVVRRPAMTRSLHAALRQRRETRQNCEAVVAVGAASRFIVAAFSLRTYSEHDIRFCARVATCPIVPISNHKPRDLPR